MNDDLGLSIGTIETLAEPKEKIWTFGYKMCLEVFRAVESKKTDPVIKKQLKECALAIIQEQAKCANLRISKTYVKRLKQIYLLVQRLQVLFLFLNDLEQLPLESFHPLNQKINSFSGKLRSIIKYNERKLRKRNN